MTTQFITSQDGTRIAYDVTGKDPALMLLAGTRNRTVIDWVRANREALDGSGVRVEIINGLDHQQEFSRIDRVFPVVHSFLMSRGEER
jgi:hypothetical protein